MQKTNTNKEPIIAFDHVTKKFSLQTHKTFKEFLPALFRGQQTKNNFTALSNINFTINRGETVGIIGPNGSGKSTILKLIAGVMTPTSGIVTVHGRVSPLIELGAGFHPELTGRENIYLNASILGLSRLQTQKQFDSIVKFADIGSHLDEPLKHYSSGMYMRLGFAIAVHVAPQILIVDEILAVGDPKFQQKCFAKMKDFKKQQTTIVYVSHNLESVKKFCTRTIYLNHSKIIFDGSPTTACQKYLAQKSDN